MKLTTAQILEIVDKISDECSHLHIDLQDFFEDKVEQFRENFEEILKDYQIPIDDYDRILNDYTNDYIIKDFPYYEGTTSLPGEVESELLRTYKPSFHEVQDILDRDFKPGTHYETFDLFKEAMFQNFGEGFNDRRFPSHLSPYLAKDIVVDIIHSSKIHWHDPEWVRSERADKINLRRSHLSDFHFFAAIACEDDSRPVTCLGLYKFDPEKSLSYNESKDVSSDDLRTFWKRIRKDSEPEPNSNIETNMLKWTEFLDRLYKKEWEEACEKMVRDFF